MRFSSKLNYALLSILMVRVFLLKKKCFIAVGLKHVSILINALQKLKHLRRKCEEEKQQHKNNKPVSDSSRLIKSWD